MAEQIGKPKYRIGIPATIFWVLLAFIFDLFSLIPFVGDVLGPIFWIAVSVYLWKIGCGFLNGRRLAVEAVSLVAKMIPIIQELPIELTAGIIAIIFLVRLEDATGAKILPTGKQKIRMPKVNNLGRGPGETRTGNSNQPARDPSKTYSGSTVKQSAPLNVGGMRQPSQQPQVSVAQPSNTGTSYNRTNGGTSTTGTSSYIRAGGGTSTGASTSALTTMNPEQRNQNNLNVAMKFATKVDGISGGKFGNKIDSANKPLDQTYISGLKGPMPKTGKAVEMVGSGATSLGKATERGGQAVEYGGKGVKYAGQTAKYAGKGIDLAGKGVEAGGKVIEGAGKVASTGGSRVMQAGIGMSATGVGAIAGVPLAVVGGATAVAGKAAEVGGKVAEGAGKAISATGKATEKVGDATANAGKKVENAGESTQKAGKDIQEKGEEVKEFGKGIQRGNPKEPENSEDVHNQVTF